jgi:ABC-2 type transport system ATP-binding protein
MGTMDYIALNVSGLNEPIVKNNTIRWRWRQASNAQEPAVALDCGSFQIRRGEVFGVLGNHGSGKSALVRDIAVLLAADDSRITVSGHAVLRDELAVKRLINRVLADGSLFKTLTPMENLIYGARLYGLGEREAQECTLEVLKQIGLDEEAIFRPVEELSAHLQQKVVTACAALTRPAFLLLNEPTMGLSDGSRQKVQSFIEELRDVYSATILLTTSDVQEADELCDRVAILDKGQIVALDTPAGLKSRAPHTNNHEPTLEDVFTKLTGKTGRND